MEKTKNIFIKIDEFIFQKLDIIKAEGFFQKFNDTLSTIDERAQKIIAQIVTFTLILIPFCFSLFLLWGNYQIKKSLEIKKQILEQISFYEGNKNALNTVSSNYLAPTSISDQSTLDNRIRNLMSQASIDQQKISIMNFNIASTTSSVSKIEADLIFRDFGTQDFSALLKNLTETERFKITKIDLKKNKENNLLQGTVSVMHLGQNMSGPTEE